MVVTFFLAEFDPKGRGMTVRNPVIYIFICLYVMFITGPIPNSER